MKETKTPTAKPAARPSGATRKSPPVQVPALRVSRRQRLHYRLREASMLLLLVVAAWLCMALASFSPQDPGFSQVGSSQVRNAGGPLGAWVASFLHSWLGQASWLLPPLLLGKSLDLFIRRRDPLEWWNVVLMIRLIAMSVLLAAGAALMHVQFAEAATDLGMGGIIGKTLGNRCELLLNVHGSTLLLIGLILFSLSLFTELSWFRLMEQIGRVVLDFSDLWRAGLQRWRSRQPLRQAPRLDKADAESLRPRSARQQAQQVQQGSARPLGSRAAARSPGVTTAQGQEPAKGRRGSARPLGAPPPAAVSPVEDTLEILDLPVLDEISTTSSRSAGRGPSGGAGRKPAVVEVADEPVIPQAAAPASPAPATRPVTVVAAPAVAAPAAPAAQPRPAAEPRKPVVKTGAQGGAGQGLSPLPPLNLLDPPAVRTASFSVEALESMARLLEAKLREFGVEVEVVAAHPGPVITRFEIQPAPGIKVSRITNLAKDLARSMAVLSVRVVEVIPGKTTVGIEVPNEKRQIVRLSEVLQTQEFAESRTPVPLALGQDISGHPVSADLARMPHLLVAGTTGSGKSVGVNAMLLSILFKSTPQEVRLIMIDPKMLELSIYEGIPHLLCPVVTDMKEAANALRWCVAEMDRRYKLMAAMGVRNLAGFNRKVTEAQEAGKPLTDPLFRRETPEDEPALLQTLPTIVVVIDEFADMMMIVGKKVEELIARIAQKARAAGIHLILATQRPSVDVITGLIKANIPTRIAFQVSSKIDSRTILDQGGAEQLLGHGDMLYLPPGTGLPVRVHGAFVSDDEVHRLVEAWKERGAPDYIEDILNGTDDSMPGSEGGGSSEGGEGSESDPLYDEAVRFVTESRRASISAVQRKLKIGYNRAARMIEAMEMAGVVTSMNSNGSREVIAPAPVRD